MNIDLDDEEALVLSALLHEYGAKDDGRELKVKHAAERNALWAFSAQLEKHLVALFQQDYAEVLSKARACLEQKGGTW